MRRLAPLLLGITLFLPLQAAAQHVETIDFRGGNTGGKWQATAAGVSPSSEGLQIHTTSRVVFTHADAPPSADAIELVVTAPQGLDLTFLFQNDGMREDQFVQFPLTIAPSPGTNTHLLPLDRYSEWNGHPHAIGFAIPDGQNATLVEIHFLRWSMLEKMENAFRSFWKFDQFARYSINFLWGPILTFTPHMRDILFTELPPHGWSFNRFLYPVIGILLAALLSVAWFHRSRTNRLRLARWAVGIVACAWVLFDIRMGAELLSYVAKDYRTFVRPPPSQRSLRYMIGVHPVLAAALPKLTAQERVGLVTNPDFLLDTLVFYDAYPTQVVLPGDDDADSVTLWLVLLQPDARVDSAGRLTLPSGFTTAPGHVVEPYGPGSFLFAVDQ